MIFFSLPLKNPENETILLERAIKLTNFSIYELAYCAKIEIPTNINNKGWVGILMERYLGARVGNKPQQDFPSLGIELKTIPVNQVGKPLESTFISMAPMIDNSGITWENSYVRYKLSRVLWIPIVGQKNVPLVHRIVGLPFLWSP